MTKQRERASVDPSYGTVSTLSVHVGTEPRVVQRDTVSLFSPPWTIARAVELFRAAGLKPTTASANVIYPGIPVPGTSVTIQGGQVQLFIFGDANSSAAAATSFANTPAAHALGSKPGAKAAVVLSTDNLLAIVVASDNVVLHKVRDAINHQHVTP